MRCTVHAALRVEPNRRQAVVGQDVSVICTSKKPGIILWYYRNSTKPFYLQPITKAVNGQLLKGLELKFNLANRNENQSKLTLKDVKLTDDDMQVTCTLSSDRSQHATMKLTVTGK